MDKNIFEKSFIENLNKNFPEFSKYFDFKLNVFCELSTYIFEINKCLILELNRASITLTNNLLERLLKLALIYNETGIGPKPVDQLNSIYDKPNNEYSSYKLGNSIEKCKKLQLINDKEKTFLFDTIRELMRNGFSHADSTNILANLPDNTKIFSGNFLNPSVLKEVQINQKTIPFMQEFHISNFANANAKYYFDFVFNLIFRIEKRLIIKFLPE